MLAEMNPDFMPTLLPREIFLFAGILWSRHKSLRQRRPMTQSRIAEWILSQVLPPDRAASTVGDWLEDAPNRGNIWFWSSVFGTAASAIWNDFANNPRFVLGLAFRSFSPW